MAPTLTDILVQGRLGQEEATIYVARPWSPSAPAILVRPEPDGTAPIEQDGQVYEYFLEAFIAKDVLDDWRFSRRGAEVSEHDQAKRLIDYAEKDA